MATIEQITGSEKVKDSYQKIYNSDNAINTEVLAHLADTTAHTSEHITFSPITGITSTNVQDAVVQVNTSLETHIASVTAHEAEKIVFNPITNVTSTDVQGAVTQVNTRVSNIIASSGTSDTEVVDARNSTVKGETFTVLDGRLEATEQDLKTLSIDIIDTDNTLNYETIIKVVNGKPVLEYEEAL